MNLGDSGAFRNDYKF